MNAAIASFPLTYIERNPTIEAAKTSLAAIKNTSTHTPGTVDGYDRKAKLIKASQEFEAVFLSQMLNHMFKGIEVDPLFGGGDGEEMFTSFLVDEYGKLISKAGGIGLADTVAKEFLSQLEVQSHD